MIKLDWTLQDDLKLLTTIRDYINLPGSDQDRELRVRVIVENALAELTSEQLAQFLGELIINNFADPNGSDQ